MCILLYTWDLHKKLWKGYKVGWKTDEYYKSYMIRLNDELRNLFMSLSVKWVVHLHVSINANHLVSPGTHGDPIPGVLTVSASLISFYLFPLFIYCINILLLLFVFWARGRNYILFKKLISKPVIRLNI